MNRTLKGAERRHRGRRAGGRGPDRPDRLGRTMAGPGAGCGTVDTASQTSMPPGALATVAWGAWAPSSSRRRRGLFALMVIGIAASAALGLEQPGLLPFRGGGIRLLRRCGALGLRPCGGPERASLGRVVSRRACPGSRVGRGHEPSPLGELFFFAGFGFYLGLGLFAFPWCD